MNPKSSMNPFRSDLLAGKKALVTGAGKGIGRACAARLAECGATVTAVARTAADLEALADEVGTNIEPLVADATSDQFYDLVAKRRGYDVLVNNLGINQPQPFVDVPLESFDAMLDINVRALFRLSQVVVRNMLAQDVAGSIINISSQMGHIGSPNRTIYCLTKHAVEGLTKALAVELAPNGIRVNCVSPGPIFVAGGAWDYIKNNMAELYEATLNDIPRGSFGSAEEVANAVAFLASPAASLITGVNLVADGGFTKRVQL